MKNKKKVSLEASEIRYRRLFEAAKDGILILDADTGAITDANPFLIDMLGYPAEEIMGKKLWEISPFKDITANQETFERLKQQEYVRYEDLPLQSRSGQTMQVEFVSNVYTAGGKEVIQCNIRDITARKQAEEDLRNRTHEAEILHQAAASLTSSLDLNQVLDNLLNQLAQVVSYDSATVFLLQNEQLLAVAGRGLPFPEKVIGQQFPVSNEIFSEIRKNGRPQIISDVQNDPRYQKWEGEEYVHGWMGTLLIVHGEFVGFLTIDSRQVSAYNETHVKLAQTFANQAAIAIQNARLYEQAQSEITERKRAEEALRESETLLHKIAENYPNSYLSIIEKDLTVGFTSGQEIKKQNLDPDAFVGMTLEQVFGDQAPLIREHYLKTFAGNEQSFELFINDQYQFYRTVPLYMQDGSIPRILSVVENITERKRAEQALRESESKYRSLIETAGAGVTTIDIEGKFVLVNQALCDLIGYSKMELIGQPFVFFLHPDDTGKMLEIFQSATQHPDQSPHLEFRLVHKDGHTVYCYSNPTTIWHQERITGFNAIVIDITERKQAEEALRASQEKYRDLVAEIGDGIFITDERGEVTFVNPALVQIHGFEHPEQLVGRNFMEFVAPSSSNEVALYFRRVAEGELPKIPVTLEIVRPDGMQAVIEVKASVKQDGGKITGTHGVVRDITERKRAESKLNEQLAELQRWHTAMLGREGRILVLKREVNELLAQAGQPPRYPSAAMENPPEQE
jgi:PAS domain S-box-containing protein